MLVAMPSRGLFFDKLVVVVVGIMVGEFYQRCFLRYVSFDNIVVNCLLNFGVHFLYA